MSLLVPVDRRPHDCCNVPANCKVEENTKDRHMERCQVCGCRHFTARLDPGMFAATVQPIGQRQIKPRPYRWH